MPLCRPPAFWPLASLIPDCHMYQSSATRKKFGTEIPRGVEAKSGNTYTCRPRNVLLNKKSLRLSAQGFDLQFELQAVENWSVQKRSAE